ncbi:MAG: TetR/AcrR family transcriptional regulator C-terminal domain-containing protein [Mogibacterium sp.]|nr:TetR/AcrR family transcriptional regulator C-terminal domain-containing protein [Mogibacterium sp.]
MTKPDRTRQWIAAGYLELAKTVPLRKITVQKLCDHVGVNRSTFYYHFDSIQALIHWIYHTEVNEPVQRKIRIDPAFLTQISAKVLGSVYRRKEFWQRVLNLPTSDEFISFMLQDTMENWHQLIQAILKSKGLRYEDLSENQRLELNYITEYYCVAHHRVALLWMQEGMKLPPEQLAAIIDDIAMNGFGHAVNKAVERPSEDPLK